MTHLRRLTTLEELANAAAFLASANMSVFQNRAHGDGARKALRTY
jgi:hypothetical protein